MMDTGTSAATRGKVWYSSSGTGSYTSADPAGTQRVSDMAWTGTHIVASRRSGKIAYATPANARAGSWSAATSGVSVHLFAVASDAAGAVVIVGASGTILHSTDDGATWASRTSGVSNGPQWRGLERLDVAHCRRRRRGADKYRWHYLGIADERHS